MDRRTFLTAVTLIGTRAVAQSCPCAKPPTLGDLRRMDKAGLDRVFAGGDASCVPVGTARGVILLPLDAKCPRVKAFAQGLMWRGKVFRGDGTMVNRWLVGTAVEAKVVTEASWADGAACVVLDYPRDAAVFGNTRDELRKVGPGLWLGRYYEKCPAGKLQGYFALTFPVQ